MEQDTRVELSNSITHYISSNVSLCVIKTTYSLTLTTDSSLPAVIQCNQTSNLSYWPTTGFNEDLMKKVERKKERKKEEKNLKKIFD